MSGRPIAGRSRVPVTGRRTRTVRRASRWLSATRAGAALAMLVSAAAIYGVASSSAFAYADLEVDGAVFTNPAVVEAALAEARGENLFRVATAPLESRLEQLPTVEHARIDLRLPGTLAVSLDERQPVLIWQVGDRRWLVDADGGLFAELGHDPPAAAARLPVIEDRRASSTSLAVGGRVDPVDLDAATRLASLHPVDVGSTAAGLTVSVTDETGFVLASNPAAWSAVFGFYTPSLRTTDLIPGQVRLLRSLLVGREATVDRVILASTTDGTYTPKASPSPSGKAGKATPKPSRDATPKPMRTPRPGSVDGPDGTPGASGSPAP
jgi:POTRA domain-containing FtsQ-type protein